MITPRKGHIFYYKKDCQPCVVLSRVHSMYACKNLATGEFFMAASKDMDIRLGYNADVVKTFKKYFGKLNNAQIAKKCMVSEVTFYKALKAAEKELKEFANNILTG